MDLGVAICQLGVSKIYHDRYDEMVNNISSQDQSEFLDNCFKVLKDAIQLFEGLKFNEGKEQCLRIQQSFYTLKSNGSHSEEFLKYKSMVDEDNSVMLSKLNLPNLFH